MKYIIILLIALSVVLSACTTSIPEENIASFDDCVAAGNPVMESYPRQCSANGQTFVEEITPGDGVDVLPNDGLINIPNDATNCPEPRPTVATREYMPVMGSNGVEYVNWRTACMDVDVEWYGSVPQLKQAHTCSDEQKAAQFCTLEYNPVCGLVDNGVRCIQAPCPSLDAKTFSNGCSACSAQAVEYYQGACEEQTFIVCNGEAKTGFDPEEFAKNTGGICVDVCPGNYDVFTTQIGVQQCIPRYDKETIESWSTCEASSDSCDCVNAYETTANEELDGAQYRCVPQNYASRLLFRGGLDRLDENGEQSVMIA